MAQHRAHIQAIETVKQATSYGCADCVKIGGTWVHLRTCQECGITVLRQSPNATQPSTRKPADIP